MNVAPRPGPALVAHAAAHLKRLQALPVDELKIDKSFVQPIRTGREDAPILTSMIAMAHNLGLVVIAEGVETAEQAARLTALGCEHLQGFYFSRPQPGAALTAAIAGAERLAATGGLINQRDGVAERRSSSSTRTL